MRSISLAALALGSATLTISMGQDKALVPAQVRELGVAQLRIRQLADLGYEDSGAQVMLEPVFEAAPIGTPRLMAFWVWNATLSHSPRILIGFDGAEAVPLGGTEHPDIGRAAAALGFRLRGLASDSETILVLARLADPNGGVHVEQEGLVETIPPTVINSRRQRASQGLGYAACVRTRSEQVLAMGSQIGVRSCFQANVDGRIVSWAVRQVGDSVGQ